MSNSNFSDLAKLMKRQPLIPKQGAAPDAETWLENFTLWLEESYHNLVPHIRDETLLHC